MNLRLLSTCLLAVSTVLSAFAEPEFVIKRKLSPKPKAPATAAKEPAQEETISIETLIEARVQERLSQIKEAEEDKAAATMPKGCQCARKCGKEDCQCATDPEDLWECLGQVEIDEDVLLEVMQAKKQTVSWSGRVKILSLTAPWCVNCEPAKKDYAPWFSGTKDSAGNQVYKVSEDEDAAIQLINIDEHPEIMADNKLKKIPAFILMIDGEAKQTWEGYPGRQVLYDALSKGITSLNNKPEVGAITLTTLPVQAYKAILQFKEWAGPEGSFKSGMKKPREEEPQKNLKITIPAKFEIRWWTDAEGFHIEVPEGKQIIANYDIPIVKKLKQGVRSILISPDDSYLTLMLPNAPDVGFNIAKQ